MTDIFPIEQPPHRPKTPSKIEWYEFLLNENLLEEHLSQDSPDPSGPELAVTFLRQSQNAIQIVRNLQASQQQQQAATGPPITPGADPQQLDDKHFENKRSKALKILALRSLAFLRWNLAELEDQVPLPLIHEILLELLRQTMPEDLQDSRHLDLHLASLPDEVIFALQLYHRWCVRILVRDSFPKKPNKTINIPVPGLVEPNGTNNGENGSIIEKIKEIAASTSVEVLEGILGISRDFRLPIAKCFTLVTDSDDPVVNDWSLGEKILYNEMACQICNDLGSYFMLTGQYAKAKENFRVANEFLQKSQDMKYCEIDRARLSGYLQACNLLGTKSTLADRLNKAVSEGFQNIGEIFQEDNLKQELKLQSRLIVEDQMANSGKCTGEEIFFVKAANAVRRLQEDVICPPQFTSTITAENVSTVLMLCDAVANKGSYMQNANIKVFVRNLCYKFPESLSVRRAMKKYLSEEELSKIQQKSDTQANLAPSGGKNDLDIQLRDTYEPSVIRNLVDQLLKAKTGKQNIINISQAFYLPRDIYGYLESIPPSSLSERIQAQLLIAKARTCLNVQNYSKARELLVVAEGLITKVSYNISKLLQWELIYIDLCDYQHNSTIPPHTSQHDLTKKVKSCITALQVDHMKDVQPRVEIISCCVAFLLSMKEWSHLINLTSHQDGFIMFGRLLASLCQELPTIKSARKSARELWEAVLLIFTVSAQQKRSNSGATSMIQRETLGCIPPQAFSDCCLKIREASALSALISCLTKLYSTLQDGISIEIFSDYPMLWPTAVSSSGSVTVSAVQECLVVILDEAIRQQPSQVSWLRTRADLAFAHNQYTMAMRGYLQAGVVSTDFFSESVPHSVYDKTIYKRMIKCCSYLQCYTQVAVLCQFLTDVDYPTAFKAFQEKSNHDAMDTYYSCIWDVTMLEYLINLHHRRGEIDKKQFVMRLINQLELNSSNSPEILEEAAKIRKSKFLRALAKQYL